MSASRTAPRVVAAGPAHLGAAADAFDREPPVGSPLLDIPTFVPTPHLGAATRDAARRMGEAAARNVVAVLTGTGHVDVVRTPA